MQTSSNDSVLIDREAYFDIWLVRKRFQRDFSYWDLDTKQIDFISISIHLKYFGAKNIG